MSSRSRSLFAALALAACFAAGAGAAFGSAQRSVRDIRFWTAEDHTRVVIDLSGEVRYRVYTASAPHRIVVELKGCRISSSVGNLEVRDGSIDRIRVNRLKSLAQVVLDLPREASFSHFPLKPSAGKPHRVVIDVARTGRTPGPAHAAEGADRGVSSARIPAEGSRTPGRQVPAGGNRIIIIDPGHGGVHPGSVSRGGVQEKTLTLKLAKKLKAEIESHPGYTALLVRDRDIHLDEDRARDLVKRVNFARENRGDVFVSLHFNSSSSRKLNGLELYFLSLEASDENAGAVAERENLLDEAGANGAGFNDDLKSILFDVSRARAIEGSSVLAEEVAKVLRVDPPIAFRKVKQAPFLVLRGLSMPSILVEGGYLSNRQDATVIGKDSYLSWLARSLAKGIIAFLEKHPQTETAAGS